MIAVTSWTLSACWACSGQAAHVVALPAEHAATCCRPPWSFMTLVQQRLRRRADSRHVHVIRHTRPNALEDVIAHAPVGAAFVGEPSPSRSRIWAPALLVEPLEPRRHLQGEVRRRS